MKSFINIYSFKCLLGQQSKDVEIVGNIAKWTVGKKHHLTNLSDFNDQDIKVIQDYKPCNFHYLTPDNIKILQSNNIKIEKTKLNSTCIDLTKNLSYAGRAFHGIRGAINKNSKLNLMIKDKFDHLNDVKNMIEEWSNNYTDKYFRDFSGKNMFFYKNNFHQDCHNIFIYDQSKLIAFASLSPGEESSYIIGKALFKEYPGLSEYADDLAYQKAISCGTKVVNLGQSKGGIADYKNKFPNTYSIIHYDGKII